MKTLPLRLLFAALAVALPFQVMAWDYDGHRVANQLALAALPSDFPAFALTPAARERIAFLGGEPDRWRNVPDLSLRQFNGPDHYIDLEELAVYGLKPEGLPVFRYDFAARLAVPRAAHPEKFPPIDPLRNEDHTRELIGFLPWTVAEYYGKLKSEFAYLKALEEAGTPEEIANAQQNIIYTMGVMGHFTGDSTQPLHTTIHHHGWIGPNPHHYTTNGSFHSWIDGGYFAKTGGLDSRALAPKVRPARVLADSGRSAEVFNAAVALLVEENQRVEPLYQLQAEQRLSGEGERGLEGRAFLEARLVEAGEFLGDLWLSAWKHAPEDTYLKTQLAKRKAAHETVPAAK